ncbi:unnamed protein product, partial [marine sediment metagenome]
SMSSVFFGCFEDVKILPNNFFTWLNTQINDHGFRFAMAIGQENCLISTKFFKNVQLSIKDLEIVAKKLNVLKSLPELINNSEENKVWDKSNRSWT